jgi:hypothetical protein
MKYRNFAKRYIFGYMLRVVLLFLLIGQGTVKADAISDEDQNTIVLNPYAKVDWSKVHQHKAALHFHTLQSDGFHSVDEVINSYRRAGYTIMAITDHDIMAPNVQVKAGNLPQEEATPYPKEPKPKNHPAAPTWPWNDYGCSSPENLNVVGIKANEFTYKHHINSYYNDSGWYGDMLDSKRENWEDFEISVVCDKGGLAIINHPGTHHAWYVEDSRGDRHTLDWYVGLYKNYSSDCLIGIEVTNCPGARESYDEALWDQLLARFMPERPVWGFGNDDMHRLSAARQTFNIFLLSSLTSANVRKAMESGQFFFCKSSKGIDYRQENFFGFDVFPSIERIDVDGARGTITIEANDYDEIIWISSPESLEPIEGQQDSYKPWPLGRVVHKGKTLEYRDTPGIKNYVRAELHNKDGDHIHRTFTNPFGFQKKLNWNN